VTSTQTRNVLLAKWIVSPDRWFAALPVRQGAGAASPRRCPTEIPRTLLARAVYASSPLARAARSWPTALLRSPAMSECSG